MKDKTPAEIAEIRKRRETRRTYKALGMWVLWLAVFSVGYATDSVALMWIAFALSMANIALLNYEAALRAIAGRPRVDYRKLRKMEKRELPRKKQGK